MRQSQRSRTEAALFAALSLFCMLAGTFALEAQIGGARPLVSGMDHIPVVVADLDKAQADFRALGFTIKPGRVHADGIRNAHVKFRDGTEIELITASKAVDALTSEYTAKIKASEGPVYFGLFAPDPSAVAERFSSRGVKAEENGGVFTFPPASPLHPLFIGQRNKTPSDKPEYFEHKNGAERLSALWVRDSPELREALKNLGISLTTIDLCGFDGAARGIRAELPEGELYLIPSNEAVVAARVEVRSLEDAEQALRSSGAPFKIGGSCDKKSVWISPSATHGIWLELVSRVTIRSRPNAPE